MKYIRIYRELLLISIIIFAVTSCGLFSEEKITFGQQAWYSFDVATVVQSITSGKTDVFTAIDPPSKAFYEFEPSNYWDSRWNQDDYELISNALHETWSGEKFEPWFVYKVIFTTRCNKVENGFYNAQFTYYKMGLIDGRKSRIVYILSVDPAYSIANIVEKIYSPATENWPRINLDKIKITAEDALQIAEEGGGYKMRSAINNACYVSLSLAAESPANFVWRVIYVADRAANARNMMFDINPYTGEIK